MIRQPSNVDRLRAAWRAMTDGADGDGKATVETEGDTARVYVQGMIGGWRMDAGKFVQSVHNLDVPRIDVHINSVGGFVYDAVSMYEALLHHPATVHTHIDGLAASAASFLALAGDQVHIARAGRVMIHDVQGIAYGSPAEIHAAADLANSVSDDIAGIYAERAGGKPAAWRKAMTATTWYSAQQAVDAGLANEVAGGEPVRTTTKSGASNRSRLIKARAAVALGGVK
jgi:ATP-dependent protease ClpP protease subunit